MKKIYLSILVLASFLFSCEGNLEPNVYDKLTGESFPKTPADAESLVYSVYYKFRGGEWDRYNSANDSRMVQGEFCTDEFTCIWNGYWGSPFNFTWRPDEFPFSKMYYDFVPAVTTATSAIYKLNNMGSIIEKELLKRYIAELKVARAYFMYDLYNLYGPVPVITDEADIPNLNKLGYKERPTKEQMVGFIKADLTEEIISSLPEKCRDSEYGRMDQGAALMCLLKLSLHEKDWNNVIKCADAIKALGYDLEDNYKSIWSIDNEQNNEIIFPIVCKPTPEGVGNNFRAHVLPPDWKSPNGYPSEGWNGYKVPKEFYDTFDKDDKRLETLIDKYINKDGDEISAIKTHSGALPLKYSEDPAGTGANQGVDYVIYRYADVVLAKAEALNEINGPKQEAIDLINDIRERAFGDNSHNIKLSDFTGDRDKLREHILKERGWEFFFEGLRREDLIRHGKFVEYANDPSKMGNRNPQKNARDLHVLYPIPNKVIVESGGIIKQNPGYDY
ncbi:RagB/SusD family nutrient uptake outer membrane protein [Bacteroides sp.]|uniref:RagB/SusD family nutrient uptake outer membrane protein n=1 Tax=Bacteroides sp. TaxID=29523 RepID=UPI0025BF04A5|nr:RagB/SusD family nutrient uptake outer membrane protein [Bacteroides sp.]